MKKVLLLSTIIFATYNLYAQVIVTQSSFPAVNTSIPIHIDTALIVNVGNTGSGNVWNFAGVQTHNTKTFSFVSPASTPFGNQYITSNYTLLSINGLDTNYIYVNNTTNSLKYLGSVVKKNFSTGDKYYAGHFSPSQVYLNFPTQSGSTLTSNSGIAFTADANDLSSLAFLLGIDSVRIQRRYVTTKNADASGTITTPSFSAVQALRVTINETITDSVLVRKNGSWGLISNSLASSSGIAPVTTKTTKSYEFYAANTNYIVATVIADNNNVTRRTEWRYSPTTNVETLNNTQHNLIVYPNPSQDYINIIANNNTTALALNLYTINGQKVLAQQNNNRINLTVFPAGIYYLQVMDAENKAVIGNYKVVKE